LGLTTTFLLVLKRWKESTSLRANLISLVVGGQVGFWSLLGGFLDTYLILHVWLHTNW
jgi:hypothetical protein